MRPDLFPSHASAHRSAGDPEGAGDAEVRDPKNGGALKTRVENRDREIR